MRHALTETEAEALREHIRSGEVDGLGSRIFDPIALAEGTGRAACRACGEKVDKGEQCIAFYFDPFAIEGATGSWGKLAQAYMHVECKEGG